MKHVFLNYLIESRYFSFQKYLSRNIYFEAVNKTSSVIINGLLEN